MPTSTPSAWTTWPIATMRSRSSKPNSSTTYMTRLTIPRIASKTSSSSVRLQNPIYGPKPRHRGANLRSPSNGRTYIAPTTYHASWHHFAQCADSPPTAGFSSPHLPFRTQPAPPPRSPTRSASRSARSSTMCRRRSARMPSATSFQSFPRTTPRRSWTPTASRCSSSSTAPRARSRTWPSPCCPS